MRTFVNLERIIWRTSKNFAGNADFKKIYDHLQAFRNEEYLWWQVAEYSYDSFMIRSRGRG